MATNKTIQPTNVTVQIPEMADKPNQATNSNCLDKIIDGVNANNNNKQNAGAFYPKVTITGATQSDFDAALNTQLASMNEQTAIFVILNGTGATVKPTYGSRCLGILYKRNSTYSGCLCVGFNSSQMLANGLCSSGTWTWDVPASNSNTILTKKTYTIAVTATAAAPLGYYGSINIQTDKNTYGEPVSIYGVDKNGYATPVAYGNNNYLGACARAEGNCSVTVVFSKQTTNA